jgi:uncharacterized protein
VTRPTVFDRVASVLPGWLTEKLPLQPVESAAVVRRRRRVVAATALAGAGVLGTSLSTRPDSPQFYVLTGATAATWVAGGLLSGPLHRGWMPQRGWRPGTGADPVLHRPVLTPVLLGAGAFGVFYGCALVARRIPVLDRAISSVLQYADEGHDRLVLLTTLANGAAEEVFFRGALFAAVGERHPVAASTGVYMVATTATRNPALVLASGVLGVLFGLQRRASGGIQAPLLTHLTWSALMLRYLPPLFRQGAKAASGSTATSSTSGSSRPESVGTTASSTPASAS